MLKRDSMNMQIKKEKVHRMIRTSTRKMKSKEAKEQNTQGSPLERVEICEIIVVRRNVKLQ